MNFYNIVLHILSRFVYGYFMLDIRQNKLHCVRIISILQFNYIHNKSIKHTYHIKLISVCPSFIWLGNDTYESR